MSMCRCSPVGCARYLELQKNPCNTEKPLKNTEKPNNITENPFCLNNITGLCVDAMLACRLCLIHIRLTSLFL